VIAHTAAELVDARDAGLGVYRHDQQPNAFLYQDIRYEDIREAARVEIYPIPDNHAGPGPVIDRPVPVRAQTSAIDPTSTGKTVLEVAIRIQDQVFANLYLSDKADGEQFSDDDEAVIVALATAAGIAIENARRFEQTHLRQAWTEAARGIATELLAGIDTATALRLIADTATSLTTVGHCLLVVPRDPGTSIPEAAELVVIDSIGSHRDGVDEVLAVMDTVVRAAFVERAPLRLPTPDINQADGLPAPIGPVLILPLHGIDSLSGVLVTIRPVGAPPFSDEQLDTMTVFADQVAVALRLVDSRRQLELDALKERDRIADDLHDQMMQRLFAARAFLQDTVPHTGSPDMLLRVSEAIDELQHVAQKIWTAIFDLQPSGVDDTRLNRRREGAITRPALDIEKRTPPTLVGPPAVVVSAPADHGDPVLDSDTPATATV
jgi:GAF domain-containing protein